MLRASDDMSFAAVQGFQQVLNSTQLNEQLWTQVLKHLSVHIYLVTSVYQVLQSTWFAYWSVADSSASDSFSAPQIRSTILTLYKLVCMYVCMYVCMIPVRSAVKSYKTSWCIQNLSKRAFNRQTVSTSTTQLGRLFQILTIRAVKEYFRVS